MSEFCCPPLRKAVTEMGTDNESYGCLISGPGPERTSPAGIIFKSHDRWTTGMDLPPIKYCPWCGTKLKTLSYREA